MVSEQDEIYGVKTINWESSSWKYLSFIGDEQIINLQRTEVHVFSDSVLCLGKIHENPNQTLHGKKDWRGSKVHRKTETWTESMVSQRNSSGMFSQDSIRCSSAKKSNVYCTDLEKHQKISQEEFYLCRCSTTFPVEQRTMKKNVWQMLDSYHCMQEDWEKNNGHSLVLVQKRIGTPSVKIVHKVNGTKWRKMMVTLAESGHPVFRATSPLSRGMLKSKGGGKLSIHYCADLDTIKTVFRTITSVNQLSLYGAVAEMCEEYESYHAGRPVVGRTVEFLVRAKCDQHKRAVEQ